jgi:hypothetical protein
VALSFVSQRRPIQPSLREWSAASDPRRSLAGTPTFYGYGRHAFDSGEFHFLVLLSRIPCRNFRDSTRLAAVIPYRLDDGQEDDDAV